jgi:hypothetical protein
MEFVKVNNNEIKVVTMKEDVHIYPYEWLVEKRTDIQRQKNIAVAEYDIQLAELDILIAKCKELGVAEKAVILADTGEIIGIK